MPGQGDRWRGSFLTRRRFGRLALAGATVLLAACGGSGASGPAAKPTRVEITASDLKFEPKDVTVKAGEITFAVRNTGSVEHNFLVEDQAGQPLARIANIPIGRTEQVTATLRPGRYPIICNLPGHKEAGMTGTLTVTS